MDVAAETLPKAYYWIVVLVLSSARFLAIFAVMPVLSSQFVTGMARNAVILALALIVVPTVAAGLPQNENIEMGPLVLILVKEGVLGMLLGFLGAIPFWIAENVGNFVDNQRGATMGAVFAPLTGSQDSPIGVLLLQTAVVLFFVSGAIFVFLGAVYESYSVWPVFSAMPQLDAGFPTAILMRADEMLRTTVILAAPAVIIMFLATLGLGLINRTVPQLNVFFLAMPVKSALGIFFLMLYTKYLYDVLGNEMRADIVGFLKGVLS